MTGLSTLCYIEKDGKYLMLHRTVKENDVNKEKWIGVGGHFEKDESPEECLLREVREETGYTLTSWRYRGIVTFVSGDGVTEYMSLFTADGFQGDPIPCDEGELAWVDIDQVETLNIWEGDKIFFRLLAQDRPFFSLKLVYDGKRPSAFRRPGRQPPGPGLKNRRADHKNSTLRKASLRFSSEAVASLFSPLQLSSSWITNRLSSAWVQPQSFLCFETLFPSS